MFGLGFSQLFLALFLVVFGVTAVVPGLGLPPILTGVLALIAGVLIFIKR